MALVWKKTAPKIWSKVTQSKSKKGADNKVATNEARAEYRRKFLDGLKFYCESPSLILNSDLPADLVEYVTSQGFPIEALGIILEAKKIGALSGSENQARDTKSGSETLKFSEISRKLVEEWMTSDSCSEAFVSLSIGEEIPGILAETSNFQRILFTIVDLFHLNGQEFLRFLLQQCLLTLATLAHAIREDAVLKVRSQPLSSFLDRIFLRFHSDSEHFRPDLMPNELSSSKSNPFIDFCFNLANGFENDFIGKRLLSKTLLNLGNTSVVKIAKTLILIGKGDKCAVNTLLQPSEPFLNENAVWKHALLINIPFKTITKSLYFWSNWATYLFLEGSPSVKTEIWSNCVQNWTSLCNNTYLESKVLIPASFALISLAKEVRTEKSKQESEKSEKKVSLPSVGNIFESITKCLDSTDDSKRSCGMAIAQIIAELHFPKKTEEFTKLEFESQSLVFKELINFYNTENIWIEVSQDGNQQGKENVNSSAEAPPILRKPIKILDSDDEEEPEEEDKNSKSKFAESPYEQMGEEEFPVDERLQSLRLTGQKIPVYFSEITECLIGDGKSRDEAEKEALKEVAVLKIPVLLSYGVRIDANMASLLSKMLIEMDGGHMLEIPIIFGLFEMSSVHPYEVYDSLATITFDKEHHTVGHRTVVLSRYNEIVQLISRQKCFSCYSAALVSYCNDICSLTPDFMNVYYESRKNLRRCKLCVQKLGAIEPSKDNNSIVPVKNSSKPFEEDMSTLTWREIVDRRVAAKTRYFVTPRKKTILIPDEYSAKLVPIIWSSLANRLASRKDFFLSSNTKDKSSGSSLNDMLLAHALRVLGRIILGTAGPQCPHLRNIAAQVGDLVSTFIIHHDKLVRRAVLSLLAVTVTTGEGKTYIVEALSNQENLIEKLKSLASRETDAENSELFANTLAYITTSAFVGSGFQLGQ